MKRIKVRKETFALLMERTAWPYDDGLLGVKDEGDGMLSFNITEGYAEHLAEINADPDAAILALLQGRT